jgi:hypothetical protein|tara:strand:- start:270 stop:437 length:168 start_codon:yes stop_codon:yes gene_type:complete
LPSLCEIHNFNDELLESTTEIDDFEYMKKRIATNNYIKQGGFVFNDPGNPNSLKK